MGLIPGLGRSPGEGNGNPLQYSGLEKSMDCIAPGVAKSQTRLSHFHFHCILKGQGEANGNRINQLENKKRHSRNKRKKKKMDQSEQRLRVWRGIANCTEAEVLG